MTLTMGSSPRSIQSVLHTATPAIGAWAERARFLRRLQVIVLETLPEAAAAHIQVANCEQHRLRLHVSNGSWATRLRYMQAAIARALAQRMQVHIEALDVRVRAIHSAGHNRATQPRELSATSRDRIRRVAAHIDDPALAGALARLAAAGRDAKP